MAVAVVLQYRQWFAPLVPEASRTRQPLNPIVMKLSNPRTCALLGLLALGLTTQAGAANIVADFDGGNSTTLVDAWVGIEGNGWVQTWRDSRNYANYTAGVKDTNSLLPGSGNYLSASFTAQSGGAVNKQGYVARMFNPGYVTADTQLVVSFLFRPDSGLSGSQTYNMMFNANNVVQGTGATNIAVINSGVASNATWVFSGKQAPGNAASNMSLDSGMQVIAGDVYSFEITLDMATKSYMASVKNLTANTAYSTSEAIYFRYDGVINNLALEFGAFFGTGNNALGTLDFSLDSISVAPVVPEAGTLAAAFAAVGLGVVCLCRRKTR